MAKAKRSPGSRSKKPVPLDSIEDPALRLWTEEIRRRQKTVADLKRRPFVVSRYVVNGESRKVARPKSDPLPMGSLLKKAKRRSAPRLQEDAKIIASTWEQAVGQALAAETRVYSFLRGVLTIEVMSSSLLQEIRQFHHHAIFSDLVDSWKASQPLLRVVYRLGKKR